MVGENIAWGESYLSTPANIVKAWMNSPPHKANVLNGEFEEIGLGIVPATPLTTNAGATYTTDFGRRRLADQEASAGLEVAGARRPAATQAPRSGSKSKTQVQRRTIRRKTCRSLRRTRGARRAAVRVAPRRSCGKRAKRQKAAKQRSAARA
jgi:hypothetical protein